MSDDAQFQLTPIIKSWFWLHLVSLVALLLQSSTPAEILGRYSQTAASIIAVFSLTLPLVWKITRWLPGRLDRFTSPWQPPAVLLLSVAALTLLWFWPLGPTDSYLIIRLYLTVVLLTGVLWSSQRLALPAWSAHLPWALALASGALLLGLSTRFPGLLWTDEGYLISAALGFAQKGYPNVLMFQPAHVEWYSLIPLGMGRWFQMFGVSVAAGRAFIFLIALASLGFTYAAARWAFSSTAAWSAVIIGAFALLRNNYLRPDIGVTLTVAAALAGITLAIRRDQAWPHLLAGAALSLSLDGHPNAYRFGLAFGLAYLLDYIRLLRQRRRPFVYRPLVYLLVGGIIGFAAYFLFYATVTERFLNRARSPFPDFNPLAAPAVLVEQFQSALRLTPLLFGAAAFGALAAWRRRQPLDRLLLVVILAAPLILALAYGYYRDYYLVHSVPVMALLAAGLFAELFTRLDRRAQGVFVLVLAVMCASHLLRGWIARDAQSYDQALVVAERVREATPPDAVLVGIDPFYSRLYDYSFVELNTGIFYAQQTGLDERAAWERIAPTAVALVHGYPIPPTAALKAYVEAHDFVRSRCWLTSRLGLVELFVLDAPPEAAVGDCAVIE